MSSFKICKKNFRTLSTSSNVIKSISETANKGDVLFAYGDDNVRKKIHPFEWSKNNTSGAGIETMANVAADSKGNVYIAGTYTSDPLVLGEDSLSLNGVTDMYIAKLNSEGKFVKAINSDQGGGNKIIRSMVVKGNYLYVCGHFTSEDFKLGGNDLSSLNSSELLYVLESILSGIVPGSDSGILRSSSSEISLS